MYLDLPIDGDGKCMSCKDVIQDTESINCTTCATPWHVLCLKSPPETLAAVSTWICPDCSIDEDANVSGVRGVGDGSGGLVAAIKAIQMDATLSEEEKAKKRQELMGGKNLNEEDEHQNEMEKLVEGLKCTICKEFLEKPVSLPCGHNFCLKCFQKSPDINKGKQCGLCRKPVPKKIISEPRINSSLVMAIRLAKTSKPTTSSISVPAYQYINNANRPETAFTTERAKKAGKANACSGQIFVTIAPDHFGPILAEHDPKRNRGVLVGDSWDDRLQCRQYGAHFPHVAGIAGQCTYGAQSVALSGGYIDDEDHGEWFLYTGSGGRDLSGNKRTNKNQSFDQKFEKLNEALRISCRKGYPVRVVRSHKEKRSVFAPESGVRYDGVYRIEKCWRKEGVQGFKVCRYLFVRCDNEPAPWTTDEQGDRPRPLPEIKELKKATDITARKEKPSWDYVDGEGWKWVRPPPESRKALANENGADGSRVRKQRKHGPKTIKEKLLKEFSCLICHKVMTHPLTTPCAHNFCKLCLQEAYHDQSFIRERTSGGRSLRAQKIVKKCPCCPYDLSDFLQNAQVNIEVMDLIASLQKQIEEEKSEEAVEENTEEESAEDEKENITDDAEDEKEEVAVEENAEEDEEESNSDEEKEPNNGKSVVITEKKLENASGDSEVNEVALANDCESPGRVLRKRKAAVPEKGGGKKKKVVQN